MGSAERIRDITRTLVSCPSVSPDARAETRCAETLIGLLPRAIEHGQWRLADGRPVVWALLRGRSPRTIVLLGHYDTVGVAEFAALGAADGEHIAFDTRALREHLLDSHRMHRQGFAPQLAADLEQERASPGTWMFGRGALDMKSGLAAAVGVLERLLEAPEACEGSVLFVAAPDEEHESAGMLLASEELVRFRERQQLDFLGVLNLDYSLEPAAYRGVMGKVEVGCYVLGRAAHVGAPFAGVDALQLAAEVVRRVTRCAELVDRFESRTGPPPIALHLDDFKTHYSIETAADALVEFNLLHFARPLETTIETMRREVRVALGDAVRAIADLAARTGEAAAVAEHEPPEVFTYGELVERARTSGVSEAPVAGSRQAWRDDSGAGSPIPPPALATASNPRRATVDRVRRLARAAGLTGPAAVVHILPPFYPHALPGRGPLPEAVSRVLAREQDVSLGAFYPFITDASYVAWRCEPHDEVARHFPALGREYHLPFESARALDLDVVNLGPWGRDPHGVYERVHRDASERLPDWIEAIARVAWSASMTKT